MSEHTDSPAAPTDPSPATSTGLVPVAVGVIQAGHTIRRTVDGPSRTVARVLPAFGFSQGTKLLFEDGTVYVAGDKKHQVFRVL